MKSQQTILPLVDLVFLALGGILGAMTQMERVTAIPVDVAHVGQGVAIVKHDNFSVVTLTSDELTFDGVAMNKGEIASKSTGKTIILRADKNLPTEKMMTVLADLVRVGANVSLEIKEESN